MKTSNSFRSFYRRQILQRPITNVFIDGLNLYHGALSRAPELKWLNLEEFIKRLIPGEKIGTIHYFTAKVIDSRSEDRARERQNTYLRALRTLSSVEVHEGYFTVNRKLRILADTFATHHNLFIPKFLPAADFDVMWQDKLTRRTYPFTSALVEIPEEKVSDVSLGAHLVRDCIMRNCDKAIVISNDGDFRDAIRLAVESGIPVRISNPQMGGPHRQLGKASSGSVAFPHTLLIDCQLPKTLLDKNGRQIHRPREWQ